MQEASGERTQRTCNRERGRGGEAEEEEDEGGKELEEKDTARVNHKNSKVSGKALQQLFHEMRTVVVPPQTQQFFSGYLNLAPNVQLWPGFASPSSHHR